MLAQKKTKEITERDEAFNTAMADGAFIEDEDKGEESEEEARKQQLYAIRAIRLFRGSVMCYVSHVTWLSPAKLAALPPFCATEQLVLHFRFFSSFFRKRKVTATTEN